MSATIAGNLSKVRAEITETAMKYGRDPKDVKLLAVSKTFPASDVEEAFRAGQLCFGENRVQELETKVPVLPSDISWHLIGHLQSNKTAKAAELASWIHSVDSVKLIRKLDRCAAERGKKINILLEINVSGEDSKDGLREYADIMSAVEASLSSTNLLLKGLMTMAELGVDERRVRKTFAGLRELRGKLENEFSIALPELSMGMSGDYAEAIAEGSTIVRIGTAIFGNRG